MNNEFNHQHELQQQWDRAVERAAEQAHDASELGANALNEAAGLRVESGLKGGWGGTYSCGPTMCNSCEACN